MTRCGRCKVRECLCAEIPTVVTRTRFLLVRHAAEAKKSSNTGRLAALALPNSELYEYGRLGAPLDETALAAPDTWLLYPEGPPAAGPPPQPARVVVLDGTWQQARHMRQRIVALRAMPI